MPHRLPARPRPPDEPTGPDALASLRPRPDPPPLNRNRREQEHHHVHRPTHRAVRPLRGHRPTHQRPGALAETAARCNAPADALAEAYRACRPPCDAAQQSAPEYWTAVLRSLSLPADAHTIEELRLADIDNWSRVGDRMVAYAQSLRDRAEVALLSNIPPDHADAFLAAQLWLWRPAPRAFIGSRRGGTASRC
ncbi:hypothetical protein [Streptomyces sp. JNUCC 63]